MKGRDELRAKRVAILLRRRGRHDVEQIVAAFEAGESAAEVARRFRTSRQNAWLWQRLLIDSPPPRRCSEVVHALAGTKAPAVELVEVHPEMGPRVVDPSPAPPSPAQSPMVFILFALLSMGAFVVLC